MVPVNCQLTFRKLQDCDHQSFHHDDVVLDELEQYLADEEDFDLETPVLKWWLAKEDKWPNLAKII